MISQSYYNKYRPKTFKDIKGSKSAEILEIQIKNNRTTHAYIFAGPPGTGKTTLARVASAHLLCNDDQEDLKDMVLSDEHPDVYEINCAVNNGVDHIRENVVQLSRLAPTLGKYKIFILDEAQNCTQKEIVTLMTRVGEFSKCFILADPDQSDLAYGKSGGFEKLQSTFSDEESKEKGIYSFHFTEDDIKRSDLVKFIVKKLKTFSPALRV